MVPPMGMKAMSELLYADAVVGTNYRKQHSTTVIYNQKTSNVPDDLVSHLATYGKN